jgi:hypothetical protein
MVKCIEFQRLKWKMPIFSSKVKFLTQKQYSMEGEKHIYIKYEMANIHYPNVYFIISIWKPIDAEIISRFKIQRIIQEKSF